MVPWSSWMLGVEVTRALLEGILWFLLLYLLYTNSLITYYYMKLYIHAS